MEEICMVCGKSIEYPNKSKRVIFTSHQKICISMKEKYGHIDIEELKNFYYNEEYSIEDLKRHYKVSNGLRNYMSRLGLSIRGISEQRKSKLTSVKYANNHNFLKSHPSRIKWESELLENEGIVNVFQRDSVKIKIRETLLSRYGEDHPMKVKSIAEKCFDKRVSNGNLNFIRFSSIHKKVCSLLNDLGIEFTTEHYVKSKDCKYFYDIKINNLLIEVNGNYWHANPNKYKENDMFCFHGVDISAKEIWLCDENKKKCAIENSYDFLTLWESDILNNIEDVKSEILNKINC